MQPSLIGLLGLGLGLIAGYLVWGQGLFSGETSQPDEFGAGQPVTIAPRDFAFLPCPRHGDRGTCLVIAAGGKRVLVGAPAGIGAPPQWAEGALGEGGLPDAILLLSLDAAQIEGLDELRSRVWEGGLSQLPLVGGAGLEEITAGLNQTYIVPDAVAYVRRTRQRSFDKAPFAERIVRHGDIAFNTGDLTIATLSAAAGQLAFHVTYGGESVVLSACLSDPQEVGRWPVVDYYIGCDEMSEDHEASTVRGWPQQDPVFIQRHRIDPETG